MFQYHNYLTPKQKFLAPLSDWPYKFKYLSTSRQLPPQPQGRIKVNDDALEIIKVFLFGMLCHIWTGSHLIKRLGELG